MKINFLGDSITQGAGAERPENMYTTLVAVFLQRNLLFKMVKSTHKCRESMDLN